MNDGNVSQPGAEEINLENLKPDDDDECFQPNAEEIIILTASDFQDLSVENLNLVGDDRDGKLNSRDQPDATVETNKSKQSGSSCKSRDILGLADPRYEYDMNHNSRGACAIINNKNFHKRTGQSCRDGTDVDAVKAEAAFKRLGFDVTVFKDQTVAEMKDTMMIYSRKDFSDADCFACVILSHGDKDYVYGTNGIVQISTLVAPFKGDCCDKLRGKPKLFFIQACRGTNLDSGVEHADGAEDGAEEDGQTPERKIPVEADFLMAYSTVPGYYSWRNSQDGSWFIESLVRVINEHASSGSLELQHLMVVVNRLVAFDYKSCTEKECLNGMKQMPSTVSMLTKLVYFRPKKSLQMH